MSNKEWPDIASKLATELSAEGFKFWYPYPENVIDELELPCAVLNEPDSMNPTGFTFSAQSIAYSGNISLIVLLIPDNQLRLYGNDIARITQLGRKFYASVYANRALNRLCSIALGEGRIARLSPNVEGESGEESAVFGGMYIPYTVTVQYGSND